jgi:hypothetical protein
MNGALIERNRRAVYHALNGVFQDFGVVMRAFDVWEEKFADPRGFRVNLYVNAIAQTLGLDDFHVRALASSMYAAMTMPERNLPALPLALRGRRTSEVPITPQADVSAQTGIANPRLAVFAGLLAALIDGATRMQKFDDFIEALQSQEPELSPSTRLARNVWISSAVTKLRPFANSVPGSEQRIVINDVYVALCDACGPVTADRILASAVRTAEQAPEAQFHSPRTFL